MVKIANGGGLTPQNFVIRTVDLDTRTTISVNAAASTISDTQNQFLSADGGAFAVGDLIRISYIDPTNPNNGTARITVVTAGSITIDQHSGTLTTQAAGDSVNIVRLRKTFELVAGQANLDPTDGVSLRAIVQRLYTLYKTDGLERFDTAVDETFPRGLVATFKNGWEPHNQSTIDLVRDGAIAIRHPITNEIEREYVCVQASPLPTAPTDHQIFYWWDHVSATGGADLGLQTPINAVTVNFMNQLVLIYDRSGGNAQDYRASELFLKLATPGYVPVLINLNEATGEIEWYPNIFQSGIQTSIDPNLADASGVPTVSDTVIDTQEPYISINFRQEPATVQRTVGGVAYPFNQIVSRAGATKRQVHTKLNRLIRYDDATDIDSNPATQLQGRYSGPLTAFVGEQITVQGFAEPTPASEANDTVYVDANGITRRTARVAAFTINVTTPVATLADAAELKVFLASQVNTDTSAPIKDADGADMIRTFSVSGSFSFSVSYGTFNQFGHPPNTDIPIRYTVSSLSGIIPFEGVQTVRNNVVQAFSAALIATTVNV